MELDIISGTNGKNGKDGANGRAAIGDIPTDQRMLLLPHCLRPSQGCPGRMTRQGLDCTGCDDTSCKIYALRQAALKASYGSICVAPGGRLAVRRVAEVKPSAIVAVACDKELEEGVAAVSALDWPGSVPPVVQIPLTCDGCVDTDVDLEVAVRLIES
jgi:geranylgeranyl diphosphate synthase type II